MLLLQPHVLAGGAAAGIGLYVYHCIASPLYKLPGPWYSAFTNLVLRFHELRGQRTNYVHRLHLKYGPAVRLSPDEAAFCSIESIKEIYASGGSGYEKTEFYDLFMVYGER